MDDKDKDDKDKDKGAADAGSGTTGSTRSTIGGAVAGAIAGTALGTVGLLRATIPQDHRHSREHQTSGAFRRRLNLARYIALVEIPGHHAIFLPQRETVRLAYSASAARVTIEIPVRHILRARPLS